MFDISVTHMAETTLNYITREDIRQHLEWAQPFFDQIKMYGGIFSIKLMGPKREHQIPNWWGIGIKSNYNPAIGFPADEMIETPLWDVYLPNEEAVATVRERLQEACSDLNHLYE